MNDITQAIGELAHGGLMARAIEPAAGEGLSGGHTHESACLNCGTLLIGTHCHACGQHAHVHKTLGAFLHDLLHGVFHLEGKIWHTLPLLAWRPGELTRRYIAGERARFVSPMALFLFSVFLMFAVFQLAGIGPPTEFNAPVQVGEKATPEALRKELADLKTSRAQMGKGNFAAPFVDQQIARLEKQLGQKPAAKGEPVVLAQNESGKARLTTHYTGIPFIDRGVDKWRENPGLMAYKLQSNSYKFS